MWVEIEKVVYHHNCRNEILDTENCSFSYYFSHSAWANILHILYLCNDILWIANEGTQQVIEPELRILVFIFKFAVQQQQRLSLYNKTTTYAINLISYFYLLINEIVEKCMPSKNVSVVIFSKTYLEIYIFRYTTSFLLRGRQRFLRSDSSNYVLQYTIKFLGILKINSIVTIFLAIFLLMK